MASIVICGGSVLGLTTGLLLARDGHEVLVLENDAAAVPATSDRAWDSWSRRGVPQFRQPHTLFPRFTRVLEATLPDVLDALLQAGCTEVDMLAVRPPSLAADPPRPDDHRFRYVTGRRPVVESAVARVAARQPGLTVRRGVRVTGLLGSATPGSDVPTVTGVVADGRPIAADLVVDAMGRRSPAADWLTALGARRPHEEGGDAGFVYYTRFYAGPDLPARVGPALAPMGTFSVLTLPGDNGTWSVTLFSSSRDSVFKQVRDPGCFSRVVRSCPAHAQWLQGEPLTDVLAMGGIVDRYRRFVLDGRPVALRYAAVGDAWACTNPSAGRGLSVGLLHAVALRDTVRTTDVADDEFPLAWDAVTESTVTPWYRLQRRLDAERFAEMTALREQRDTPPADGRMQAFAAAMAHDPEVFRAFLETTGLLAHPDEVLARPGMAERLAPWAGSIPRQMPGPSRETLEAMLT